MVYILRRPDRKSEWDFLRCNEVQDDPNGFMDMWSRGAGKSTIISWALAIQDGLNYPNDSTAWFSHNRPIAKSFLRLVKTEFEENSELISLFPDVLWDNPQVESPKWSENEGLRLKRTANTPEETYEAWGLIESLPERKHFSRRIYDDIITDEHVRNRDQVQKAVEQFDASLALSTGQRIMRIVGVYHGEGDPYQQIEDRGLYPLRVRPSGYQDVYAPGLDPENLRRIEAELRTNPRRFAFHYLLDRELARESKPMSFSLDWLVWENDPPPLSSMHIYIAVDPAGGRPQSISKTAMWVVGLTSDRRKHVIDGCVIDVELPGRWEALKAFVVKYYPYLKGVIYESYGMQADTQYVEEKKREASLHFTVHQAGGFQKKSRRIDLLMSPMALKQYSFKQVIEQDVKGIKENIVKRFVEVEYTQYSASRNSHAELLDQFDCLSRFEDPNIVEILTYPRPYGIPNSVWETGNLGGGYEEEQTSWMSR